MIERNEERENDREKRRKKKRETKRKTERKRIEGEKMPSVFISGELQVHVVET